MKKKSPIQQTSSITTSTIYFLIKKEFESTKDSGMRLDLIHSAKSLGLDALALEMEQQLKPSKKIQLTKELYISKMKYINEDKFGVDGKSCICCGRPMKAGEVLFVHMNEDWLAVNPSIVNGDNCLELTGADSQGCFPIGNSCANKMKGFTFTMEL